ncbi:hypothetical protein EDB80DRAFT_94542 [Ilyonectria destructans]|nr:hypothetical protein EDB80DRAFT_94542 [Ilyonectria destructans]
MPCCYWLLRYPGSFIPYETSVPISVPGTRHGLARSLASASLRTRAHRHPPSQHLNSAASHDHRLFAVYMFPISDRRIQHISFSQAIRDPPVIPACILRHFQTHAITASDNRHRTTVIVRRELGLDSGVDFPPRLRIGVSNDVNDSSSNNTVLLGPCNWLISIKAPLLYPPRYQPDHQIQPHPDFGSYLRLRHLISKGSMV